MGRTIRTKADVETHHVGYGGRHYPAVNVKVYADLDDGISRMEYADDREAFRTWVRDHVTDAEVYEVWWPAACESMFEQAAEDAKELFGRHVRCYLEGRSGGWLIVDGLPEIDTWDAIMLGKWRRFAKWARGNADYVPASAADLIAINVHEPLLMERDAAERALDVPDVHVAVAAAATLRALAGAL